MHSHQLAKADHRPDLSQQQFLFDKQQQNTLPKRPMLIPPPGSPLLAANQFSHLKQPYPPHLLNHLYMNNAMARDHPLYWVRHDLRQRMALASPRMDYYHQEGLPANNINNNNNNVVKENGKEPPPTPTANEGSFSGDVPEIASDPESNNQRKVGHSIKTGVSLRCAYCNGDFRSR